ncbi:Conserved oligomeric golgi complex subunit 2 [Cordyceps militaris CM01]|uniref:Conserved oligomeric Golgi complex subunit 2 n=1 Tax=Cordyceps militaris (strain CM01) TaxID=983644 RepID=G3JPB3_CORMM|nr:Conserved oligomeric golgi complex subunit 2 [Cordyceps militaris CM01]EGX89723.1 Conserved oligomeric golgi complex subunit 2 [Cordyceps militaris CM01]
MASTLDRPLPSRGRPSTFNLSSSSSDLDDDAPLPFPEALPRSDFLTPAFDPAAYLSALPHRHQTLEDLRADLRDRSAAISSELLELVNANSTTFLSLGTDLRGGDDKVEDVRVSLLGFRRAVEDVRAKVVARRGQADVLTSELHRVRADIERGRAMVEMTERLASLEERLALSSRTELESDDDDDSEEEEEDEDEQLQGLVGSTPTVLMALAKDYNAAEALLSSLTGLAFTAKLETRLIKCRKTLLLDLSNAIKESRKAGAPAQDRVLKYLAIYRILGAQDEAVKTLRTK